VKGSQPYQGTYLLISEDGGFICLYISSTWFLSHTRKTECGILLLLLGYRENNNNWNAGETRERDKELEEQR
jgi:hypothetical protein